MMKKNNIIGKEIPNTWTNPILKHMSKITIASQKEDAQSSFKKN